MITNEEIRSHIETIEDLPKKGIRYRNTESLRRHNIAFNSTVKRIADLYRNKGIRYVVGKELESLIWASAVAHELGAGILPMRKKVNSMKELMSARYEFEAGKSELCIDPDGVEKGAKVLIVDYILATGGTMKGMIEMLKKMDLKVEYVFCLIDLKYLETEYEARQWLAKNCKIDTFVAYNE